MHAVLNVDMQYGKDSLTFYVNSAFLEQAKAAIKEIAQENAPQRYRDNINKENEYEFFNIPIQVWLVDKDQND
jgi:hypothetical protein